MRMPQSLIKQLSLYINKLPRFSIQRVNQNPAFNVQDKAYIQGILFWSLLPLFGLFFWLCLFFVFGCVWCCFRSSPQVVVNDKSRFNRRLTSTALVIFQLLSCFSIALLVYGSERIHKTNKKVSDSLMVISRNFSLANQTANQITEIAAKQMKLLINTPDFVLQSLNILQAGDTFEFVRNLSSEIAPFPKYLVKVEFIRWISVICLTTKFCFLTIMICKCCQMSRQNRFSCVSFGMVWLTISVYGLLCIFYLPLLIGVSDFCINPQQSYLESINNSNNYKMFSHYYDCKSYHFDSEIAHIKGLISDIRKQIPKSESSFLNELKKLLSHFSNQLSCEETSKSLKQLQYMICKDLSLYILICTIAVSILCFTIPISSILCKCLAYHESLRKNTKERTNISAIGTITTNRIRRALRMDSGLAQASAPPILVNQRLKRERRMHGCIGNSELTPMLPPRQYQKGNSSPPPYNSPIG